QHVQDRGGAEREDGDREKAREESGGAAEPTRGRNGGDGGRNGHDRRSRFRAPALERAFTGNSEAAAGSRQPGETFPQMKNVLPDSGNPVVVRPPTIQRSTTPQRNDFCFPRLRL